MTIDCFIPTISVGSTLTHVRSYLDDPVHLLSRDMYFLKKLLNLKGDDGFKMNEVLVSLWYIMVLWPLGYSMLLLSTRKSAYALLPYFILWNPLTPLIEETELKSWPLIFFESKVTTVGSTVEMIDLDRDDAGSEDANLLFSGHRPRITYMRYTFDGGMLEMNEVKGGSPYGAELIPVVMDQDNQLNLSWIKHSTKASILPQSLRSSRKNEAIHKLGY
ncbi:uncharacterized protein DS421_2g51010 [Arachis hypogaea]|nr:uncharacterized protein DS421_2g51010 [Arachis hypogaea]